MKFSVFGLTSLASCLLALLTSAVFVRWVLPTRYRSELGNKNRYIAIDGVRGYLAFSVYLHHCLITVVYMQRGLWLRPPHNLENQLGETSVAIFFMITAFLFGGRVWKKRDLDIRQFFFSRIFRIYPLYIFLTLMTCIAVGYKSHWIEIDSTATNAKNILRWLMFQSPNINRYPYTKLIVAGVTWTLLYEAAFSISLPLFVWAFLKGGRPWRYVLSLAMIAAVCRYNHLSAWIAATFLGGGAAIWWRLDVRRVQWAQSKLAATIALWEHSCCFIFFISSIQSARNHIVKRFFCSDCLRQYVIWHFTFSCSLVAWGNKLQHLSVPRNCALGHCPKSIA